MELMEKDNILATVKAINEACDALSELSNDELRNRFQDIRNSVAEQGVTLDSVLVDVFAIVKETMKRFA